jgi:CheY-like chemotaxis protein
MDDWTRLAPLRVLAVDDCPDTRASLSCLFRLWGYESRVAGDGASALELDDSFRPDVVLLDVGLPGMNGHEVARRLRRHQGPRRLLLLSLSGWGGEEERRLALEAGCDAHWVKPADPEALHQFLDAARERLSVRTCEVS